MAGNVDDPEGSLDALMQVLKSLMISETTNEANFELNWTRQHKLSNILYKKTRLAFTM